MNEDAFQTVLLPILRELEGVMDHIVLIGGWVPELHRRLSSTSATFIPYPFRPAQSDVGKRNRARAGKASSGSPSSHASRFRYRSRTGPWGASKSGVLGLVAFPSTPSIRSTLKRRSASRCSSQPTRYQWEC